MPSGYSSTPLAKKLGIGEGAVVVLRGAPDGFVDELDGLPPSASVRLRGAGSANVIVSFHTKRVDLERCVPKLLQVLDVDGALWIAWPKQASKVATDVTEDTVREVFLPLGLVDNKVCAINEVWSGLRVVWRRERRAAQRAGRRAR